MKYKEELTRSREDFEENQNCLYEADKELEEKEQMLNLIQGKMKSKFCLDFFHPCRHNGDFCKIKPNDGGLYRLLLRVQQVRVKNNRMNEERQRLRVRPVLQTQRGVRDPHQRPGRHH